MYGVTIKVGPEFLMNAGSELLDGDAVDHHRKTVSGDAPIEALPNMEGGVGKDLAAGAGSLGVRVMDGNGVHHVGVLIRLQEDEAAIADYLGDAASNDVENSRQVDAGA